MAISESSKILYQTLRERGYDEHLCELIAKELNTELTASRMLGYLSYYPNVPEGEIVDEMLAIISDRDRWAEKKILEETNAKWNYFLNVGFDNNEGE